MPQIVRYRTLAYLSEEEVSLSYYEDMARQGLHLQKIGFFFTYFTQGEPAEICCRVVNIPKGEEQALQWEYQKNGWEYVCNQGRLALFRTPWNAVDDRMQEEEQRRERLEQSLRRKQRNLVFSAVAMIFCVVLQLWVNWSFGWKNIITSNTSFFSTMYIWLAIWYASQVNDLSKQRQRLREGVRVNALTDWNKLRTKNRIFGVFTMVFTLIFGGLLAGSLMRSGLINMPVDADIPAVRIMAIETDPRLTRYEVINGDGSDYANWFYSQSSLLAPRQYVASERMSTALPLAANQETESVFLPHISNEFYSLRFAALAEPLTRDLLKRFDGSDPFWARQYERYKIEERVDVRFDSLIVVSDGGVYSSSYYIVGTLNRSLLYVEYLGQASVEVIIDEMAEVLQDWQS